METAVPRDGVGPGTETFGAAEIHGFVDETEC